MTYNDLKVEFDQKVVDLQANCPHIDAAWMRLQWAPGHFSNKEIKVCGNCQKIVDSKSVVLPGFAAGFTCIDTGFTFHSDRILL